jgi:hypothetical protein
MATLVYPETLQDSDWKDANYVMANFLALKNQVNGSLDEDNLSPASNLVINTIVATDYLNNPSILPTGSISLQLSEGTTFEILDGLTPKFTLYEDGEIDYSGLFITLPIGAILAFDGAFTNNVTAVGWYKCDGTNGTISLIDKFIYLDSSSGATGGTNDAPVIEHTHTASTATESATHTHTYSDTSASGDSAHSHTISIYARASGDGYATIPYLAENTTNMGNIYSNTTDGTHTHTVSSTIGNNSATHNHSISINSTGDATGTNLPSYYKTIYIQRVS